MKLKCSEYGFAECVWRRFCENFEMAMLLLESCKREQEVTSAEQYPQSGQ